MLKDLINIRQVVSFINDILVEIQSKEEYNKLVEEIFFSIEETSNCSHSEIQYWVNSLISTLAYY